MNKTIFCMPGASIKELEKFAEAMESNRESVFIGGDASVYKLIDGELFEVVERLEKVKEWNKEFHKKK